MVKFLKQGKLVIVLRGRYAGRKAVVVKTFDDKKRILIAGLDKPPQKVVRQMSKRAIAKRSRVRPFVKLVNQNHVMVSRYTVDFLFKNISLPKRKDSEEDAEPTVVSVDESSVKDEASRLLAKRACKQLFQEMYFAQDKRKNAKAVEGTKFFYQKLHF